MTLAALLAATSLVQSALPDAVRFDLACQGSKIPIMDKTMSVPWAAHFRIDLDKVSWCGQECNITFPIERISEQEIDLGNKMVIDRTTGRLSALAMASGLRAIKIEAVCTRQPFSGFPEKKF